MSRISLDPQEIARKLAELRDRKGLTQQEFADALGEVGYRATDVSVGNYEKGTRVPAIYAAAVAARFNVDLGWLVGVPESETSDAELRLEAIAKMLSEDPEVIDAMLRRPLDEEGPGPRQEKTGREELGHLGDDNGAAANQNGGG